MLEQIKEYLKDWQFSVGGSYMWIRDGYFRADYLQGHHGNSIRIRVHPPSDWALVEIKLSYVDYERFYEGSCKSFDDFKTILRLLDIDPSGGK